MFKHDKHKARELVQQLSAEHKDVLQYVLAFLKELSIHSGRNGLTNRKLANLFGPLLLRPRER